jgi:hypothetical protein
MAGKLKSGMVGVMENAFPAARMLVGGANNVGGDFANEYWGPSTPAAPPPTPGFGTTYAQPQSQLQTDFEKEQADKVAAAGAPVGNGIVRTVDPTTGRPIFSNTGYGMSMGSSSMDVNPQAAMQARTMVAGLPSVGAPSSSALSAARQAAADRGDWGAVQASYQANGGTWQGRTAEGDANTKMMSDALAAVKNAKTIPQLHYATLMYDTLQKGDIARQNNAATVGATMYGHNVQLTDAQNKLQVEWKKAMDEGDLKSAQAIEARFKTGLGAAHLALHPGDYAGAGAAIAGRPGAPPSFGAVPTMMPDSSGRVGMENRRTGEVTMQTPLQPVTFAQAKAQALTNKQYKFTTDAQLRKDLITSGKYKLLD